MATVIKYKSHVENALRFLDIYGLSSNTDDYLYLATGKPTAWGDEANPDTPTDNVDDETGFWSDIIGVKRVEPTRTIPVVPRVDWISGQQYVVFDTADINAYSTSFYVLNSESRVYQCTTAHAVNPSTDEPFEANEDGAGAIAAQPDGYAWQYLYEIPQVNVDNLLNDTWMPVNYGDSIPVDTKDDENAVFTLGAKYVLVQIVLEDTDTDVGAPGTTYRQTAVISNPLDNVQVKLTAISAGAAGLTANSGNMLHLENKFAITRAVGQSEIAQTVLQF